MTRRQWLWITGLASGLLFLALVLIDRRIQESGGPGIVPFEIAGSTDRATEILADWGDEGKDWARVSLWLDFPYLVLYGAFFFLAVRSVRDAAERRGWSRYARPGGTIAVLPIAAAAFDAAEDVGLLLVIGGHADSPAPAVATGFAIAKFIGLAIAYAYVLAGLVALGRQRLRRRADRAAARTQA